MTFTAATSSVTKGESLRDTVETIDAMGVDAMVVRHHASGAPARVDRVGRTQRDQRRRRHSTSTRPRRCWTATRSAKRSRDRRDGETPPT